MTKTEFLKEIIKHFKSVFLLLERERTDTSGVGGEAGGWRESMLLVVPSKRPQQSRWHSWSQEPRTLSGSVGWCQILSCLRHQCCLLKFISTGGWLESAGARMWMVHTPIGDEDFASTEAATVLSTHHRKSIHLRCQWRLLCYHS